MGYKYKVKEIEIGDVSTGSGVQSTVSDINPETGTISWDIDYVPAFDSTFKEFEELKKYLTTLARKTDDSVIDKLSSDVNQLFNQYRTHLRKNYSDTYQKMMLGEARITNKFNIQSQDIGGLQKQASFNSETSMPFNLVTNVEAGVNTTDRDMVSKYFNNDVAILQFFPMEDSENDTMYDAVDKNGVTIIRKLMGEEYGLDLVNPKIIKGKKHCSADGEVCSVSHYLVFGKTVDEISTSGAAGAYLTPYAFRIPKKKKKTNEGTCGYDRDANTGKKLTTPGGLEESKSINPGATLGPGPAAGEDGVKDNAYVKQFKYQLVPKDKKGNYVQKGSGLEVKNLF